MIEPRPIDAETVEWIRRALDGEFDYDTDDLLRWVPQLLGHIAHLSAKLERREQENAASVGRLEVALAMGDNHAERCVELQRQLTETEEQRDSYRAALARHEEHVVEQIAAWLEDGPPGVYASDSAIGIAHKIREGAWRSERKR